MTIDRSAQKGDAPSPDAEHVNKFFNAARYCITIIRRFLVFADAPAIGFEDTATVEAIREDLKAGPVLASKSPLCFLLQPLQECVKSGIETLDQLPHEIADKLPSTLAEEIDPWSNNCHEAAIRIAKSLYDGIRLIEPWDNLFTDPAVFFERELAITYFVEREWQFRAMRVPKLEKRVFDEHFALRRYVEGKSETHHADEGDNLTSPQQLRTLKSSTPHDHPSRQFWENASTQQKAIMRCLIESGPIVRVRVLEAVPGAFRDTPPSDEAVVRALNRLRDKLVDTANGWWIEWDTPLKHSQSTVRLTGPERD